MVIPMSERARRNVLTLYRFRGAFQSGWAWSCDVHPHARGQSWDWRRVDWWRAQRGMPPAVDRDPRGRALRGLAKHWHDHHAPAHDCCELCPPPTESDTIPRPSTRKSK